MGYGGVKAAGETVLIVDDVESNRLILEEIIRDMNGLPVLAESGEQALELVRECHPQLVLTDISMPGMNGYHKTFYSRSGSGEGRRAAPSA